MSSSFVFAKVRKNNLNFENGFIALSKGSDAAAPGLCERPALSDVSNTSTPKRQRKPSESSFMSPTTFKPIDEYPERPAAQGSVSHMEDIEDEIARGAMLANEAPSVLPRPNNPVAALLMAQGDGDAMAM